VSDIFLNGSGDHLLPEVVALRVGEALQARWTAALKMTFPDRTFVVTFEPDEPTGGQVTFFTER
jgi:hypothetical protein